MALTSSSAGLDSIDEDRRRAAALLAQSMQAVKMGGSAIDHMEELAKTARGEKRQAGLDADTRAQQGVTNANADRQYQLEKANSEGLNADRAANLVLQRNQDARAATSATEESAARAASAASTEADRAKADRSAIIKAQVKAAIADGVPAAEIASHIRDIEATHDVGTNEVKGVYDEELRNQAHVAGQETNDRAKTAEEIRRDKASEGLRGQELQIERDRISAGKDAADKKAAPGAAKIASSLGDVTDFKSAVSNARNLAAKVSGEHLGTVLVSQRVAKGAENHGGFVGAMAGAAGGALATRQMTNDEAQLMTALDTIKAKSVKGLEGAHRAVSQHQIELVDHALSALQAGNMEQFKLQLGELERSADDTANSIRSEGMSPQEAAGVSPATAVNRGNPFE